jgi:N-acetylneuraminic acid mutarotase
MGTSFAEAQGVAKNGKLYVFGGFENGWNYMSKKTYAYTPSSDSWTRLADMPIQPAVGISHMGNTEDPATNMIYLTGGLQLPPGGKWMQDAIATSIVLGYDTVTNQWSSQLPRLPRAIGGCGAAVLNGKLHVIGGALMDGSRGGFIEDLVTHYVLDLSNTGAGWSELAPISAARNHLGVAVGPDNKIYAIGGQELEEEGCTNFDTVEAYDATTNTWEVRQSLPHGIGHISPATLGTPHGILVIGGVKDKPSGCNPAGRAVHKIHHYDPASDTWTIIDTNNGGASMVSGIIDGILYSQSPNNLDKHTITWTHAREVTFRDRRAVSSSVHGQSTTTAKDGVLGDVPLVGIVGVMGRLRS